MYNQTLKDRPCVKNVWTEWVITKQLISSWHYVTGPCDVTMWRAVGLKWIKVLREGSSLFSDRVRNKPHQIVKVVLRRHCIHNRLGCVCSLFIWLVVIYMFGIFNLHLCCQAAVGCHTNVVNSTFFVTLYLRYTNNLLSLVSCVCYHFESLFASETAYFPLQLFHHNKHSPCADCTCKEV